MKNVKITILTLWMGLMSFFSLQAIAPGEVMDDFTLPDYDNVQHSLSDYKDKTAIVIMFLSTRCPVSNAYNQRIAKLYETYTPQNVVFLGINSNRQETAEMMKTHATESGFKFTILRDDNNAIADKFGAKVTPEIFVLSGADRKVLYHGHIDDSQRESQVKQSGLADALNEILAKKAVTVTITKPFGCSIKRER